jgi:Ca2+-transporting ATPase
LAVQNLEDESAGAISLVHTAVAGRARLHIASLRGNERLKCLLEGALPDEGEIRSASASSITGNLLVHFDPALPLAQLIARLERILRGYAFDQGNPAGPGHQGEPIWHAEAAAEVLRFLGTRQMGLSRAEACQRFIEHGPNKVFAAAARSKLAVLLDQLRGTPVLLLAGAAALSVAIGGALDAAAILSVVALNAAIGFATESRSEGVIGSLRLPAQGMAAVRRDRRETPVPTEEVVPGDIMVLRPGAIIAADARVLGASALSLDESMLTGESMPVAKCASPVAADCPLAERAGMVYRGSTVVGGSGIAVVIATGRHTEAGRIQSLVGAAQPPETPMQRQLDTLGRQLALLSVVTCGTVFLIGLLRGQGFLHMLKSSIALAVAAVPEGLPTVATTALAFGVEEMRRRHVLVRRLDAIETLAAVDVIGFDKTGTLTENRMSIAAVVCGGERLTIAGGIVSRGAAPVGRLAPDSSLARLLEVAVLCNEASAVTGKGGFSITGTPTEAALLRLALDAGIDAETLRRRFPMLSVEYRAEGRPYMVSAHAKPHGGSLLAMKGSPEQVLARCERRQRNGRTFELTEVARRRILAENRRMAEEGLRVLGLAQAEVSSAEGADEAALEEILGARRFVWLGLIGLADPARRGAGELLARFDRAGIRVIMMTGDQALTAEAVARELNLANGGAITTLESSRLQRADDRTIGELVERAHVFARVSPADKLRIVQALQRTGKTVAVTGDGINDSPALRAADVGIVMGRSGSDAAREVADIVLESDDLATMVAALERGRTTYANIRKAIHYLLATNFSEILVVLAATMLGLGSPLSAIQLLWINLLSDVLPGVGLALEPSERGVLEEPPRSRDEPLLRPQDMGGLAREGAVIAAGGLAAYGVGLMRHGMSDRARTLCFSSLVGAQLLHALTCRSPRHTFFGRERLPPNRPLAGALLGSAALQAIMLVAPPLRRFMGLGRMDVADGIVSLAGATLPYMINEAAKVARGAGGGCGTPIR